MYRIAKFAMVLVLCLYSTDAAAAQDASKMQHKFGETTAIFRENISFSSLGSCPTIELMTKDRKFIKRKLCKFPNGSEDGFDLTKYTEYAAGYVDSAGFNDDGLVMTILYAPLRSAGYLIDCNVPISPTSLGVMGCVGRYPIERETCATYRKIEEVLVASDSLNAGQFTYTRTNSETQTPCPTITEKSKKGVNKTREYCVFPGRQGKGFDIRKDTGEFRIIDTRLDDSRFSMIANVRMKGADTSQFQLSCFMNFTQKGNLLDPDCSLWELEKDCPEESKPTQP